MFCCFVPEEGCSDRSRLDVMRCDEGIHSNHSVMVVEEREHLGLCNMDRKWSDGEGLMACVEDCVDC